MTEGTPQNSGFGVDEQLLQDLKDALEEAITAPLASLCYTLRLRRKKATVTEAKGTECPRS